MGNDKINEKNKQNKKVNFDNLLYLSHSKIQSNYIQNKINITKKKF